MSQVLQKIIELIESHIGYDFSVDDQGKRELKELGKILNEGCNGKNEMNRLKLHLWITRNKQVLNNTPNFEELLIQWDGKPCSYNPVQTELSFLETFQTDRKINSLKRGEFKTISSTTQIQFLEPFEEKSSFFTGYKLSISMAIFSIILLLLIICLK